MNASTAEPKQQPGRLHGKAAVVTGATSGLGRAVALAMAREGASVVAVGRDATRGQAVIDEVRSSGGRALFHRGDLVHESTIVDAVEQCRQEFGQLDIMHNNAGVLVVKELHETSNEDWQRSIDVNMTAAFWGCKHAVLAMREEKHGGAIVNTGSISSVAASGNTLCYAASKHGLLGLTKAVALAYATEDIRCNAVCPGDFDSPMILDYLAQTDDPVAARRSLENLYPTNRLLEAEDVAESVVFLASDAARGITGTSLLVDDGVTAKMF